MEAETGQATGFAPIGFIEVAADKGRLEEYRRVAAFNRYCGVDVQELSPREVEGLFPLAKIDDIEAGFYVKEDGRVNPVDVTMALAKGARNRGVNILEGVAALGVSQKNRPRVGGALSARRDSLRLRGELRGHVGAPVRCPCRVNIPNQAAEHYYLITERIPGLPAMPVLEDPANYGYYREEGGGLMSGFSSRYVRPGTLQAFQRIFPSESWRRIGTA